MTQQTIIEGIIFLRPHRCLVSTVKSWTGWTEPRRTSSWRNSQTGVGQLLSTWF